MKETFTRREVAKMLHNMEKIAKEGHMSFDAWSETLVDDNGGFHMENLLHMGNDDEIFVDPFGE